MIDSAGRKINYMRISITDRCNLRCSYCMPNGVGVLQHNDILRYEEILRIVKIVAKMGITAIRVTGGEPLVRKGCLEFIKSIGKTQGISQVSLTTNGVLLGQYIDELSKMNIPVNISLDSLNEGNYKKITGHNDLDKVWHSLKKAIEAGIKIKINCVPIKNMNEHEIIPMAQLAEKYPIDVRFIEYMPTEGDNKLKGISSNEIIREVKNIYTDLKQELNRIENGPAIYFKSKKMKGSIGFISSVNSCFCAECNRVRLTSQGFFKLCLFHDEGVDLRKIIRSGADDSVIEAAIFNAVNHKPRHHQNGKIKNMSQIGG